MQVNGKIISVGKFSPATTFKGQSGETIEIAAKRQLIVQQDCGDVFIAKCRCEESTKWETGKPVVLDVRNLAKASGMIFVDCEAVK